MNCNGKTRLRVEQELMEVLQRARTRYEDLYQDHSRVSDLLRDTGLNGADGTLLIAPMLEKHNDLQTALEEYRVALRRFHRVVVDRKFPED
jgi:hypothetical protein